MSVILVPRRLEAGRLGNQANLGDVGRKGLGNKVKAKGG